MEKRCTLCGRTFTRRWNLQRHLDDVHDVNKQKYIVKRDIGNHPSLPKNNRYNNNFSNRVTNMKEIYYNQNFSNGNILPNNYPPYVYNNFQPHPYIHLPDFINPNSNPLSNIEKKRMEYK
jgi:hypothetical protein